MRPNLNRPYRAVTNGEANELIIPETSIDFKEYITLSWLTANETESDILIIGVALNQTGMYQNACGGNKDITVDTGLAGSQTDGSAKSVVTSPATASKKWNISDAVSDLYAVQFTGVATMHASTFNLAHKVAANWSLITNAECIVELP